MTQEFQNGLRNDIPLFLAIAAWVITAGSLVYAFTSLGDLQAIIFKQRPNHSLVSATCTVVGVLGMLCLCRGLAKVVFRSGYKQLFKKVF